FPARTRAASCFNISLAARGANWGGRSRWRPVFSILSPRPAAMRFRPARANADGDWTVATDRLRSKSLPSRNPDICKFQCTAWPRPAGGLDRTLDRYDSLGNANIYIAPFAATYDFCSAKFGDFLRVCWKHLPARLLSRHLIDRGGVIEQKPFENRKRQAAVLN